MCRPPNVLKHEFFAEEKHGVRSFMGDPEIHMDRHTDVLNCAAGNTGLNKSYTADMVSKI